MVMSVLSPMIRLLSSPSVLWLHSSNCAWMPDIHWYRRTTAHVSVRDGNQGGPNILQGTMYMQCEDVILCIL